MAPVAKTGSGFEKILGFIECLNLIDCTLGLPLMNAVVIALFNFIYYLQKI
jgi:maltodextrin utilization protein YvdJ